MLFTILLFILLQDVTGIEKGNPFSDDEDYSGEDASSEYATNNNNNFTAYMNYSGHSFHHKLAVLTSNSLIKITTDLVLPSVVLLVDLENVSIIGYENPTINCDDAGGIHFDHCHNCTIVGITLQKCGSNNKPAIDLYNSSNIKIENCSFQHSVAQAIALSNMVGNVTINGCKFLFNIFKGHGTAIYYLPNIKQLHSKFQFKVTNCNFTHNGMSSSKSILYIGPSKNKFMNQVIVYVMNSVFLNNQGVPIYISRQTVIVSGNILLKGNRAHKGGAIFITKHSKLVFYKSDIEIDNNEVLYQGGALCISENSVVTFEGNSTVLINNNQAKDNGGALHIESNSNVTFKGNSTVAINNNQAEVDGGGLAILFNSDVTFKGTSTVTINNNQASDHGGAIYTFYNSKVIFEENSLLTVNKNKASYDHGGALRILSNSYAIFRGYSTVTINNNDGGAFYISDDSIVEAQQ